jgi:hypothetical protein
MPRVALNPDHVISRLRRQLSTPDHVFSREDLAQRTKIPLGTLKSLESGRIALTRHLALKISLAVPVRPGDLLSNAKTLHDFLGLPLSPASKSLEELKSPYISERAGFETDRIVAETIFEAAESKLVAIQFRFLFREALVEIANTLGLTPIVSEQLVNRIAELDPDQVPLNFRPQPGESLARWKAFEREVMTEYVRIWDERGDQDPAGHGTKETTEDERRHLNWLAAKFDQDIRIEALKNVQKKHLPDKRKAPAK